nr:hypothetical protein [Tanacetum cinerariifolium]
DDESSNDDDDDDDVEKDEEYKEEEEEEHLALADPSDEIERVVAQRVANAIEAIAIYETKTNLAHKSMSQTERQEEKVAENASNKRKWGSNHNGSLSQQNKGHKETMTTVNQGMSVDEIEQVVAQRVANAIEAIAIYETKTNLACKSMSQTERQGEETENKKRLDNTSKNNRNQQQQNKRQNTGRAYTVRHGEKKHYGGSKPLCSKCNYHHDGPCAPKCHQCNRFGHLVRDCRISINANTTNIQKGTRASQKATCYECRNKRHYRRDCLERKNQNHENQIKSTKARGVVHA